MRLAIMYRTSQLSFPISRELFRNFSSMKRSSKRNPAISRDDSSKLAVVESGQCGKQTELHDAPKPAKGKDRRLVSDGFRIRRKSKRRTRIDLGAGVEIISSRKARASVLTSESQQDDDDLSLPTIFEKKRAPFASGKSRFNRTHLASGVGAQTSSLAKDSNTIEPFDICFCDTLNHSIEESGQVLRPGMVLLKKYIQLDEQVDIVKKCRELGLGPGGFYQPIFKYGAKLRLHMMCLGKDWDPQTKRYGSRRQLDDSIPPEIPPCFNLLVDRALQDSYALIKRELKTNDVDDILPGISPDICIINFYTANGRLGLHQDRDESKESLLKGLPVVSVSIGDSAEFLYGDERDVNKAERVLLESGDVLIFGGESRHIFHGVASILQNTAPPHLITSTKLRPGRLNLTLRQY